jgi:hypothetical protein
MAKPKKPKLGKMPKSKNPVIVARALVSKMDKVKDYQKKIAEYDKATKQVEKLKTEFAKIKAKLS